MKRSVTFKIAANLIILITLITVAIGIFSFLYESSRIYNEISSESAGILERISYHISEPYWSYDIPRTKAIMEYEVHSSAVNAICLYEISDQQRKFDFGIMKTNQGSPVLLIDSEFELFSYTDNNEKRFRKKLYHHDQVYAEIEIYFSDHALRQNLIFAFIRMTAELITLSIVIFIGIYYSIHQNVLNPMTKLNQTVQKFGKQNFRIRSTINQQDEIGQLSEKFNRMADTIENYSREMENLVKEKTDKLRKAHQKLKKDLQTARKIQQSLIPEQFDLVSSLDISKVYQPMEELGGDYCDMFSLGKHRTAVIIADVSGHGLPASLITVMAKLAFSTAVLNHTDCDSIMNEVNRKLFPIIGDLPAFMTAFIGIIDTQSMTLEYSSAGHVDVLLISKKGKMTPLHSTSVFLGAFKDLEAHNRQIISIHPLDKLILYTDGLTETRNSEGEFLGEEGLKHYLYQNYEQKPEKLSEILMDQLNEFSADHERHDDITLLIISVSSTQIQFSHQPQTYKNFLSDRNIHPESQKIIEMI